jgi:hypothetical protein
MNRPTRVAARAFGLAMAALVCATCAASSAAAASPTAFYLPGVAAPEVSSGKSGLFVVPAGSPTTAPAFITSSAVALLGASVEFTIAGGELTEYNPYALMYLGKGSDGHYHIYGLPLTGTTVPKPVQIGSLSLTVSTDLCAFRQAQTNFAQPTTLFVLIKVPTTGGTCSGTDFVYEVVHYTDAVSKAPTVVDVATTQFFPIYNTADSAPGALGGLVMLNSATGDLLFYSSDAFTEPKTLVTGVASVADSGANLEIDSSGVDADFYGVTTTAGKQYLYRVSSAGVAVKEYSAAGALQFGAADESHLYLIDNVPSSDGKGTANFLEEPLAGGSLTRLFSLPYVSGVGLSLVGSSGSLLVYALNDFATGKATLNTLPVGVASSSAHQIGSFTGDLSAHMHAPTGVLGSSGSIIFVNLVSEGAKTITYASESLLPTGTVRQALEANSQFLTQGSATIGSVLQVRGITDTTGTYGGAKLYGVNISSADATPYTTTGGEDFVVPASYLLSVDPLSLVVGAGTLSSSKAGEDRDGLIFNLDTHVVVPVEIAGTNTEML